MRTTNNDPRTMLLLLFLLGIGSAGSAAARTWLVQPDGLGDAPTIHAAMDSAQAGDEVVLAAGSYTRSTQQPGAGNPIVTLKPGVDLRGQGEPDAVSLHGDYNDRLIEGHDVGTVLIEGLELHAGIAALPDVDGGAAWFTGASTPLFRDCRFVASYADGAGGAVACEIATFEGCSFLDNGATHGGAVSCTAASFSLCSFENNSTGGADAPTSGGAIRGHSATIEDCNFEGNRSHLGGAVHDTGPGAAIRRCTFRDNQGHPLAFTWGGAVSFGAGLVENSLLVGNAASRGGAVHMSGGTLTGCTILSSTSAEGAVHFDQAGSIGSCTLVGNASGIFLPAGGTVHRTIVAGTTPDAACSGTGTWTCSDLFDNALGNGICGTDGGNNFSLDPEFCSVDPVADEDVGIQSDSPCAAGNHPAAATCDDIGAGAVACGTTAVLPATWSHVKERYRRR